MRMQVVKVAKKIIHPSEEDLVMVEPWLRGSLMEMDAVRRRGVLRTLWSRQRKM